LHICANENQFIILFKRDSIFSLSLAQNIWKCKQGFQSRFLLTLRVLVDLISPLSFSSSQSLKVLKENENMRKKKRNNDDYPDKKIGTKGT